MASIELSGFLKGFIQQIKKTFPGKDVYDEAIQQGLKPGSFFVAIPQTTFNRRVGAEREYKIYLTATYFPLKVEEKQTEFNEVEQKFVDAFTYLKVEDSLFHVKPIERRENQRDDALTMLIKVNAILRVHETEVDSMSSLEVLF